MKRTLIAVLAALLAAPAVAQRSEGGSDNRWNIAGPTWYETKCGQMGFSATHGLAYDAKWVKPCSVPVRVCEYKRLTMSFIADPDRPCEQMVRPEPEGGLIRTYIKRWD